MARKTYLIANWKMNPTTLSEAKRLFDGVKKPAAAARNVTTVICPPFVFLPTLMRAYSGKAIALGGQNAFFEKKGSYTGEVSPAMLKDVGATYVILGHSERRGMGEDNALVRKKVEAARAEGLTVVLCVGERERDRGGGYLSFIEEELASALKGLEPKHARRLIVAYEPIWAIGKSAEEAMHAEEVHEMVIFIRKVLTKLFAKPVALAAPVLYGGSVEPANCLELFDHGHVDGFLVGHASRVPRDFAAMLAALDRAS